MSVNDDTQPRSPLHTPAEKTPPSGQSAVPSQESMMRPDLVTPPEEDDGMGGPGCMVWGGIGAIILIFSLAIVGMAGAAGYTTGVRDAEAQATETQQVVINEQVARFPTDVAQQNQFLVNTRLDFLQRMTPAIPQVPEMRMTATALANNMLPTATSTPTMTPEIAETLPVEVTEAVDMTATESSSDSRFDVVTLLENAQRDFNLGQYEDAIETLDNIIRIDSQFERQYVRRLMFDALVRRADLLYDSIDTVAEAIVLTNRAEEFGSIATLDISYERFIGGLYLDATRRIDLGDHLSAIRSLNEILQYQTSYKGTDITRLVFNEYVAYGDAFVFGAQPCQAVGQFNTALTYFFDNGVTAKRDAAQTACEQGTPTPPADGTSGNEVAPVGQQP